MKPYLTAFLDWIRKDRRREKQIAEYKAQQQQERELILQKLEAVGARVWYENGYSFRFHYNGRSVNFVNQSTRLIANKQYSFKPDVDRWGSLGEQWKEKFQDHHIFSDDVEHALDRLLKWVK